VFVHELKYDGSNESFNGKFRVSVCRCGGSSIDAKMLIEEFRRHYEVWHSPGNPDLNHGRLCGLSEH